ncbi:MAG: sugar phosphate isomerase/epimerase [Defluviicoccus sp.]|nr:sugar phosphate isomerase/epimerase [Defluviicoccus sp.]MDE0385761.1 sugar phosphate isomerase/epimerase [Defluviicoccus sp.]
MNRFSVNHYVCPPEVTVTRFLDAAVAAGAGAVGVSARAVAEVGTDALRAMLDARGLAVSSVNSAGYFAAKAGAPVDDHDRRMVEAAAILDAGALCVIAGGRGAGRSIAAAQARVRDGLEALADIACQAGVRLGVEPIHPVDLMTKGCVNSIADALALIDGIDGVGLILDVNHSWWDPALPRICRDHRDLVALVQLCNVIEPEPSRPRREFLSRGLVDLAALIAGFEADGYAGFYEFEIFPPDLRGRPVEDAFEDAARFMRGRAAAS